MPQTDEQRFMLDRVNNLQVFVFVSFRFSIFSAIYILALSHIASCTINFLISYYLPFTTLTYRTPWSKSSQGRRFQASILEIGIERKTP